MRRSVLRAVSEKAREKGSKKEASPSHPEPGEGRLLRAWAAGGGALQATFLAHGLWPCPSASAQLQLCAIRQLMARAVIHS